MRALLIAAIASAALGGCRRASNDSAFSCWMGSVCEDYQADIPAHKKDCQAIAGEWEQHACPAERLVGTCVTDKHQPRMYYGGAANAYTADTASASCEHEFHGTWTGAR